MKEIKCTRCGEVLNPSRVKWLEYSSTDDNYYSPDHFPARHISQGAFPFGTQCATIEMKQTIEKIKQHEKVKQTGLASL